MQCETWTHGTAPVPAGMRRPGGPTYLKRTRRCHNPAIGAWREILRGVPHIQPQVKHLCAEHAAELKPRFYEPIDE